jgi:hypothetical protein
LSQEALGYAGSRVWKRNRYWKVGLCNVISFKKDIVVRCRLKAVVRVRLMVMYQFAIDVGE